MAPDLPALVAAIRNDAWMVRHYARGARSSLQRAQRDQAILKLGLTVRDAFSKSDQFEPLLVAVVDGLRPSEDPPPF